MIPTVTVRIGRLMFEQGCELLLWNFTFLGTLGSFINFMLFSLRVVEARDRLLAASGAHPLLYCYPVIILEIC
jgi:hypothetical protein